MVSNSTCGNATNQPTKRVWALCLTRARAFLPQIVGSEIRTAGSKERRTNTVGPRSRCMRADECSGDHISVSLNESIAMARHPGRAMACQTLSAQLFQLQKQLFITGEVLSEAGRSQRKGFLHPTDRMCLRCCVLYTHSHSRAAKRPLAASLSVTPALGHRRCLIVFTVFRGAANDREMFSVAGRQEKGSNCDACSQGSARPDIRCHEKNCNSRIYGGVTHFAHIHLQSRQDTSSPNPRIPHSGSETKTTSFEFWSNRARQPTTAERPI